MCIYKYIHTTALYVGATFTILSVFNNYSMKFVSVGQANKEFDIISAQCNHKDAIAFFRVFIGYSEGRHLFVTEHCENAKYNNDKSYFFVICFRY